MLRLLIRKTAWEMDQMSKVAAWLFGYAGPRKAS